MKDLAIIIATKDRPAELRRLLISLERQSINPGQIIIVESGSRHSEQFPEDFRGLPILYSFSLPPSASRQRNAGLALVHPSIKLIGFIDDDAALDDRAIEHMQIFWKNASALVAGASFNLANHPSLYASSLKTLPLAERFGLYSKTRGAVLPSGFQTMIGTVDKDTEVKWICSGAVVWRRDIFKDFRFDEWFSGYSYLEDLDFSYAVGKSKKLYVVGASMFYHYPADCGRGSSFEFGLREVKNRFYFVRKHPELSVRKCGLSLLIRMALSLFLFLKSLNFSYLLRASGNVIGLMSAGLR